MPYRTIPGTQTQYALVVADRYGKEVTDPRGINGRMTSRIIQDIQRNAPTDVFICSHGWLGDVPAAIEQYDKWIRALEGARSATDQSGSTRRDVAPVHVALHWPSLPWGNEEIGAAGLNFAAGDDEQLLESLTEALDDTPEIRQALKVILAEAATHAAEVTLTENAKRGYLTLDSALGLGADGLGGDNGSDRLNFDPQMIVTEARRTEADFASFGLGVFLAPLQALSFWTMKKRAQTVGESSFHNFLRSLQQCTTARIHLMGHSFGCIVVSAMLNGPANSADLPRPIDSCALVQGALSLWSYCEDIPVRQGTSGYFHGMIHGGKVRGAILTTQSIHDRAVRFLYPLAAGAADQIVYDALPEYGGVGRFGIQGILAIENDRLLPSNQSYSFRNGCIQNLESSEFICKGGGVTGAHSDISGPEVANAIWQAGLS